MIDNDGTFDWDDYHYRNDDGDIVDNLILIIGLEDMVIMIMMASLVLGNVQTE